jgi:hypothetical protein
MATQPITQRHASGGFKQDFWITQKACWVDECIHQRSAGPVKVFHIYLPEPFLDTFPIAFTPITNSLTGTRAPQSEKAFVNDTLWNPDND